MPYSEYFNRLNDRYNQYLHSEARKEITIDMINAVFKAENQTCICDATFTKNVLPPDLYGGKEGFLDILAETSTGEKINVEIQVYNVDSMVARSIFYGAKLYAQLSQGQKYSELTRAVCINLLRYEQLPAPDERFHNRYLLTNTKDPKDILTDLIEFHFIELPKWERQRAARGLRVTDYTDLDRWLAYYSDRTTEEERKALAMTSPMMNQVMEAEDYFRGDGGLMSDYAMREKAYRDTMAIIDFSKKEAREEGREEGIEIGKQRGIEIGKQRGIEIGEQRAAAKAQIEIDELKKQLAQLKKQLKQQ